MTTAKLSSIEMDTSIQCRASIDTAVVTDYAERMAAGDEFPDVILFGETNGKLHIGDGWHRIMAARQNGAEGIGADIRKGGRQDALKHALGANAMHGHRRTNADKRRCVEIALAEFGGFSSRAIAVMCGVHHTFVGKQRPDDVATVATSPATRTDTLGRQQPAKRTVTITANDIKQTVEPVEPATSNDVRKVKRGVGVQLSNDAINILQRIPRGDPLRELGLNSVIGWIKANR